MRKLNACRQDAWRHTHSPLAEQHRWLASVLRGHYSCYGVQPLLLNVCCFMATLEGMNAN